MTDARARIVVAEDEAIIRLDLVETLREEGYDVVGEVGRGDVALELVKELEPDLAILDIRMPGLDGIEVAREIVADRIAAVLILTAFGQKDLVERAATAGALAYLVKPWQRNALVPAIELAIARHREAVRLAAEVDSLGSENRDLAEQLEVRKLVDRAKGKLMDEHGLSEQDAFRFVQRTAMSRRTSMREVADGVLDGGIAPEGVDGQ